MTKRQVTFWCCAQVAPFALLYYGPMGGIGWVENMARFSLPAWAVLVLISSTVSWVACSCAPDNELVKEFINKKVPALIRWMDTPLDLVLLGLLAAIAWYWTAAIWLLGVLFGLVAKEARKTARADMETAES